MLETLTKELSTGHEEEKNNLKNKEGGKVIVIIYMNLEQIRSSTTYKSNLVV